MTTESDWKDVTLTSTEIAMGAFLGLMRNVSSIQRGRRVAHGADGNNTWQLPIECALGAVAFAKLVDRDFEPTNNTFQRGGDGVGRIQVRTRSGEWTAMIVRKDDDDASPFVSVHSRCPVFTVLGWMMAKDAKQERWWRSHGGQPPAFFVPTEHLRPLSELSLDAYCLK